MISLRRTLTLLIVIAALAGCKAKPTHVTDRPEISSALEKARGAEAPESLWEEWIAPPADGHYFAAATGRLNGDAIPDLVAGSFDPGGVSIWIGREDGTWQMSFVALPSSEVRDVALADVDGDGRDEIVIVSRGGIGGLLILRAPTEGPWGRPDPISSDPGFESVATGDLNGDGAVDLVVARGGDREDGGIEMWLGDGRGGFENHEAIQTGNAFKHVVLGRIDGDEHLDAVAAGWGLDQGVRIFHGDGNGAFAPGAVLGAPGFYRRVALGDVTGDGRLDVVATTYRSGVRVFPGLDPAAEACALIEDGSFWSPLLADADGDGRLEIYASSGNGLGILGWVHRKECQFDPVVGGLPERDVWFGLGMGSLYRDAPPALIATGFSDGIRAFGPASSAVPQGGNPRVVRGPEAVEERWANGNDSFTTALGFDEYRLGVGDVVRVRLFNGDAVEEVETAVQTDGQILVPARGIGSIEASGLSPTQLKHVMIERASRVWREAEVEVVVLQYHAHKVSMLGEVRSTARNDSGPGQYALEGKTRVVDFLSKHGGPTDRADLNRVQLIQPDGRSSYLNLYRAVLSSDQAENPLLNEGDTVFVPSVTLSNRRLVVLGEVNNPGLIEIRENITVVEAIARAGGVNARGKLKSIVVIRGGLDAPEVIAVNLKDMLELGDLSSDVVLRNGDVVYVPHKAIVDVREAVAAIQPFFDLILDTLIIKELANDND